MKVKYLFHCKYKEYVEYYPPVSTNASTDFEVLIHDFAVDTLIP